MRTKGKQKYVVIGRNKTGTTSLKRGFEASGFTVANKHSVENLSKEYAKGNFNLIIVKQPKYFKMFRFHG